MSPGQTIVVLGAGVLALAVLGLGFISGWLVNGRRRGNRLASSREEAARMLEEARGEALRVFGEADDGRVELCFLTGCNRFGKAHNLASVVRTDEELERKHSVRAFRIARAIEQAEENQ